MSCARHTLNCAEDPASPHYRYAERGGDAPVCCASHLVELLFTTTELLEAAGIPHFLYWGSLLGAARHGGLIPWDLDADLGMPVAYRERLLALRPAFEARGHRLHWSLDCTDRTLSVHYGSANLLHVDIDLWEHDTAGGVWRDRRWGAVLAETDVFPLRRYPFHGRELWGPATLAGLFAWYGDDCLRVGRREYWPDVAQTDAHVAPSRKSVLDGIEREFSPARIDLLRRFDDEPQSWRRCLRHRLYALWRRRILDNRFYLFSAALARLRRRLPEALCVWLWRAFGGGLQRRIHRMESRM